MELAARFLSKFASLIVATLSCFDRVIFKGYLPIQDQKRLHQFVDHVLNMRRKDFLPFLQRQSEELVGHAKKTAEAAGRPYRYIQGRVRKEKLIQDLIRENRVAEGLVAILCCLERCRTVQLRHARHRPELCFAHRPQRVLYYYYLDANFGLMYVRVQTWFPYTVQVYVNGHDWLARQMTRRRLGFSQCDNAFLQLDDPQRVQQLADRFIRLPWIRQLDSWARRVNPLQGRPWLCHYRYYWIIEQAEYSTDLLFASRDKLAALYHRLLDHATVNFSARDVLTFLGRRLHGNFNGEVVTDCKRDRWPGARIKHRVKGNWLKMYDKFGILLRIETVINQPHEFRVRRRRTRKGVRQMVWCPMNKGVANLYQYRSVAHAANTRYLNALSVVDDPAPAYQQVESIARPKEVNRRTYAGFNPARKEEVELLRALLDGKHLLHGFRNADIRMALYGDSKDRVVRHRQRAALGRIFKRLHVRKLLAKIPHTRRWRVTEQGQQIFSVIVRLYYYGLAAAA